MALKGAHGAHGAHLDILDRLNGTRWRWTLAHIATLRNEIATSPQQVRAWRSSLLSAQRSATPPRSISLQPLRWPRWLLWLRPLRCDFRPVLAVLAVPSVLAVPVLAVLAALAARRPRRPDDQCELLKPSLSHDSWHRRRAAQRAQRLRHGSHKAIAAAAISH